MSQLEVPLSISGLAPAHRERLRRAAIKHHLPYFIPTQVTKHQSRVVSGQEFVVLRTTGRHHHHHGDGIAVPTPSP